MTNGLMKQKLKKHKDSEIRLLNSLRNVIILKRN